MKRDFLSSISDLIGLLALLTLSVGVIGFAIFLFESGVHFSDEVVPIDSVKVEDKSILALNPLADAGSMWQAPDWSTVDAEANAAEIKYGKELIANTAEFFGPEGTVKVMSNGMNCQNCHLKAGTAPLGNNYSAVFSTYPKMRARSGTVEDIQKRINDCFQRSLNGQPLVPESREMKAMAAYINWLGKDVEKGKAPAGGGIYELPLLDRAADPAKGKIVYQNHCQKCHSDDGQGEPIPDESGKKYPPLWGKQSYTNAAGLFRLSRFAGFVKANMPFGTTFEKPVLTDEEAWDVAAYVNSLERPEKYFAQDWPDISKKPIDHPFGPFADEFDESQHKLGPFKPIQAARAEPKK
ncbi:c-type cytochrome [Algoriphagus terrigena]|uniref:c-type cytochrome n=1 Tax=Algoriphagus terrigena TaxID=344884 RepID=UPI000416A8DF|nr:c-type cytochrome [Algoriphagus terrigena]